MIPKLNKWIYFFTLLGNKLCLRKKIEKKKKGKGKRKRKKIKIKHIE